jgi:hypothetical protein
LPSHIIEGDPDTGATEGEEASETTEKQTFRYTPVNTEKSTGRESLKFLDNC